MTKLSCPKCHADHNSILLNAWAVVDFNIDTLGTPTAIATKSFESTPMKDLQYECKECGHMWDLATEAE